MENQPLPAPDPAPDPATSPAKAAQAGYFRAVFPNGNRAADFYARITTGEFYATEVKLNRKGGKIVTFRRGRDVADEAGKPGWYVYWLDMAETVGHYGSSFGEPPCGTGRITAYLNGLPGPASM